MKEVWAAAPFALGDSPSHTSFWTWLLELQNKVDDNSFLLAAIVLWKAWDLRNQEVQLSKNLSGRDTRLLHQDSSSIRCSQD